MSSRNKNQSTLAATRISLYKKEIKEAGKDLMVSGMKLRSPHGQSALFTCFSFAEFLVFHKERVKMCQWLKKLSDYSTENIEGAQNVHSYIQYLRASLLGEYQVLVKPFNSPPPERLVSFGESIANKVADAIPDIPRVGENEILHQSNHRNLDSVFFKDAYSQF